ncbi:Acetolactate synthase small subunit [Geodia barretti]|uniref:Acetolactate synthase small subunit n=1 Tax=Geodia barretti TaxID=519541 RepID=A0AA35W3X5_GEOBA|nr:Acetolactate synthase small subunit [Geodia barretti]
MTGDAAVIRDLTLIRVAATAETVAGDAYRGHVSGRVVDVAPDSLIVEATGTEEKIDRLLGVLLPYGLLEIACAPGGLPCPGDSRAWRPSRPASRPMPLGPGDEPCFRFRVKIVATRNPTSDHPDPRVEKSMATITRLCGSLTDTGRKVAIFRYCSQGHSMPESEEQGVLRAGALSGTAAVRALLGLSRRLTLTAGP